MKRRYKKKTKKKRRIKVNSKKNGHDKSVDLQKIVGFKFRSLNKAYKNFKENRKNQNFFKKNTYKIFTEKYDQIAKAEDLENIEEIIKLRKNLDQQLTILQSFITKFEWGDNYLVRLLLY